MTDNSKRTTEDTWQTEDEWEPEEPFNLELVRKGVAKENQYHAMHQYLGWLIREKYLRVDAMVELITWNYRNRPPIPWKDFVEEFRRCWEKWGSTNNMEMA